MTLHTENSEIRELYTTGKSNILSKEEVLEMMSVLQAMIAAEKFSDLTVGNVVDKYSKENDEFKIYFTKTAFMVCSHNMENEIMYIHGVQKL